VNKAQVILRLRSAQASRRTL